jgi:hypothetical protein
MNNERERFFRCTMISIVEHKDPIQLANHLKPYLSHINNESLTRFYRFLTTQPSSAIFAVEDVIMNCYSNKHLFHLIQQVVHTML